MSAELLACPFCRQLFPSGEADKCPECGIALKPLAKLPPSHDALADEPVEVVPLHMQRLPLLFFGRNRGLLTLLGALGLITFFSPWVHETAPDVLSYSAFDLGLRLRWIWATGVAYLVMIPLVLSRRTVHAMRGARVAVAFLAGVAVVTVLVRLLFVPSGTALRPVRYEWGWGLYACGVVAVLSVAAALRFGGTLTNFSDIPVEKETEKKRRS
ncbi:MAG: hypothetical protein IPK82_08080 [Polyangiaceae bacterium]|nr:hypothetical protein [Polyangiaceae bacterium]